MSYLDILPSHERERIRRRMRSPEEYERLREKVKGPEDLERELRRRERMAELHLLIESERMRREQLKNAVERDVREQGVNAIFEPPPETDEARQAIEEGRFTVSVDEHPSQGSATVVALAEGKVQEKVPVRLSISDTYASALLHSQTQKSAGD